MHGHGSPVELEALAGLTSKARVVARVMERTLPVLPKAMFPRDRRCLVRGMQVPSVGTRGLRCLRLQAL
eukprot:6666138-Pyramimonas_sp.AAC.1